MEEKSMNTKMKLAIVGRRLASGGSGSCNYCLRQPQAASRAARTAQPLQVCKICPLLLGLNFTGECPDRSHGPWRLDNGLTANLAGADGSSGVTVGIYNDTTKLLVGVDGSVHGVKFRYTE